MKFLTLDTETTLIGYKNVIPELVCMSYHISDIGESGLMVPWEPIDGMNINDFIKFFMESDCFGQEYHIVGHNIMFDLAVLCKNYPDLFPMVFKWLDEGRIHDTIIREKLMNITRFGDIDFIEQNGASTKVSYSLASLETKYIGIDRSLEKELTDAPRTNYAMMSGRPVGSWPKEYIEYAITDAVNTYKVFMSQEFAAKRVEEETGLKCFTVEAMKNRHNWGLYLIQAVGSLVDTQKLMEVKKYYDGEYMSEKYRIPLVEAGWLQEAIPAMPYAKGTKDHLITCKFHKDNPEYTKGKKGDCDCPVKMKAAQPEVSKREPRFDYIFKLAVEGRYPIRLKPADATLKMMREMYLEIPIYDNNNNLVNVDKMPWKDVLLDDEGYFINEKLRELKQSNIDEMDEQGVTGDVDVSMWRCLDVNDPKTKLNFTMDGDWQAENCTWGDQIYTLEGEKVSLLTVWQRREHLSKMVKEYIPRMFYKDEEENELPAEILHGSYDCLKVTGRSGCRANDLFPSRNDQNVDPRIRECTIPRPGNVIVSTDYDRMELCTAAQTAYNLFGYSVLRDKINAGIDVHAYLGASIAYFMDSVFHTLVDAYNEESKLSLSDAAYDVFNLIKKDESECDSGEFKKSYLESHPDFTDYVVTWSHFYKHYRTFAKPTGLGYPGGLGPKTFVAYAKGTYGVSIDLATAEKLRDVWKDTFPEMKDYLDYVSKLCVDRQHHPEVIYDEEGNPKKVKYYSYDTSSGMHRAKCSFTECANGQALQSPGAEGALDAVYNVQKAVWMAGEGSLLDGVIIIAFIHDELLWESPLDDKLGERAKEIQRIMVESMARITPDVKPGAESAAMWRWNKKAESIWEEDSLVVWEPKELI